MSPVRSPQRHLRPSPLALRSLGERVRLQAGADRPKRAVNGKPPARSSKPASARAEPSKAPPIRVVVCDDNVGVRRTMRAVLELRAGMQMAAEPGSFEELRAWIAAGGEADVLLLDVRLPGMSGLEGVEVLLGQGFDVPVILMSAHSEYAAEAERSAAAAFYDKGAPDLARLVDLVRLVAGG